MTARQREEMRDARSVYFSIFVTKARFTEAVDTYPVLSRFLYIPIPRSQQTPCIYLDVRWAGRQEAKRVRES